MDVPYIQLEDELRDYAINKYGDIIRIEDGEPVVRIDDTVRINNINYDVYNLLDSVFPNNKVYVYDIDGTYVITYDSIEDAEDDTGIGSDYIWAAINNRINQAGGYRWSRIPYDRLPPMSQHNYVYRYNYDGRLLGIYNNVMDAARDLDIYPIIISNSITYNYPTEYGIWSNKQL